MMLAITYPMFGFCGVVLTAIVFVTIVRNQFSPRQNLQEVIHSSSCNNIDKSDDGWIYIGEAGGIESYLKTVPGSDVLAFRGVAYLDMHISQAMGPYMNLSTSYDWVYMLKHIENLPLLTKTTSCTFTECDYEDLVYQVLDLPWPVSPRDVLMNRKFYIDPHKGEVSIQYKSVEDARKPQLPGVIRAESPHSQWRFRSVPPCDWSNPAANTAAGHARPVLSGPIVRSISRRAWLGHKINSLFGLNANTAGALRLEIKYAKTKPRSNRDKRVSIGPGSPSLIPVTINTRPSHLSFGEGMINKVKNILLSPVKYTRNIFHSSLASRSGKFTPNSFDQSSASNPRSSHSFGSIVSDTAKRGLSGMQCADSASRYTGTGMGTVVEFESFVDSKGTIPAWFINYMQRTFPAQALAAYRKVAESGEIAPYSRVIDW